MANTNNTIKVFNQNPAVECYNNDFIRVYYGLDVLVPFNNSCFEFTKDPNQAELVAVSCQISQEHLDDPSKCVPYVTEFRKLFPKARLFVDCRHIQHIAEGVSDRTLAIKEAELLNTLFGNAAMMLVTNMLFKDEEYWKNIYYTDFLWNRQLLFYKYQPDCVFESDQDEFCNHWYPTMAYDLETKKSYWDKTMYGLNDIRTSQTPLDEQPLSEPDYIMRGYVSLNRTRNSPGSRSEYAGYQVEEKPMNVHGAEVRDYLRTQLINLLSHYPGYLGDASAGAMLVGQGDSLPQRVHEHIKSYGNLGWTPIHNAYYENSTVSIYVETLTYQEQEIVSITEKTWEPLIRGHFILPFGYAGMVRDLRETYGFKMAPFIHYNYDSNGPDLYRWVMYLAEVKRLLNLGPRKLYELKQQHIDILEYNRQVMLDTGYLFPAEEAVKRHINTHQCFPDKSL